MRSKNLLYPFLALWLVGLACSLPSPQPATPLPSDITPAVTSEPVVTEAPVLDEGLPSGMILAERDAHVTFSFFDTAGSFIGTREALSLPYAGGQSVFPISGTSGGLPTLVYYPSNGYNLVRNDGSGEVVLATFSADIPMAALIGVPAQPVLAYSTAQRVGSLANTALYVGAPETISSSQYLAMTDDPIIPLFIEMGGGAPVGVWFTKREPAGDFLFYPTYGLYYLHLASQSVSEVSGSGDFIGLNLSPDASWVAYRDRATPAPFSLTIHRLSSGETHTFPLLPNSDQGAGGGVISPDNTHVAWMEGDGNYMGELADFRSTLRFGSSDGAALLDLLSSSFDSAAGFSVAYVRPMGWLDNQTVIVQVDSIESTQDTVLSANLSGEIKFIGKGNFVCFTYP